MDVSMNGDLRSALALVDRSVNMADESIKGNTCDAERILEGLLMRSSLSFRSVYSARAASAAAASGTSIRLGRLGACKQVHR